MINVTYTTFLVWNEMCLFSKIDLRNVPNAPVADLIRLHTSCLSRKSQSIREPRYLKLSVKVVAGSR